MAKEFDPYHQWLGIRDPQRPPNHYRLLGLEVLEDDPDVIQNAADQRMGHVRTYQTGQHSQSSQQILNELSAAKLCLLNPKKKVEYDKQFQTPAPVAAPAVETPPSPVKSPPPGSTISKAPPPVSTISKAAPIAAPIATAPMAIPVVTALASPGNGQPAAMGSSVGKVTGKPIGKAVIGKPIAANRVSAPFADVPGVESDLHQGAQLEIARPGMNLLLEQPSHAAAGDYAARQRSRNMVTMAIAGGVVLFGLLAFVGYSMFGGSSPVAVNNPPKVRERTDPRPVNPEIRRPRDRSGERPAPIEIVETSPIPTEEPPPNPRSNERSGELALGELQRFSGNEKAVLAVGFSINGIVLSAGADDTVRAWEIETGDAKGDMELDCRPRTAAFLPENKGSAVVARDYTIRLINKDGEQRRFGDGSIEFYRIAVPSHRFRLLAVGRERAEGRGAAIVWDLETGDQVRRMEHVLPVMDGAISADGSRAVTASTDRSVRVWNLDSEAEPLTVSSEHWTINPVVALSPDGSQFVTIAFNGEAAVWDANTGKKLHSFAGHHKVTCAAISPDGKSLLTGGHDRLVKLWDLASGKQLGSAAGHYDSIQALTFSPDGHQALSGSLDRTVSLWDLTQLADGRLEIGPAYVPTDFPPPNPRRPEPRKPDPVRPDRLPSKPPEPGTPEPGPFVIGAPLSPVDLFARFEYAPDSLQAGWEAIPKPKTARPSTTAKPMPELIKKLQLPGDEEGRIPQPLIDDEQLTVYQGTYESRVAAADKSKETEDDVALAKELLDAARRQSNSNPGLARYLCLRAFGLAINSLTSGKGDPDLAVKTSELFDELTLDLPDDVRLAAAVAKMNLVPELQKGLRKSPAHRDQAQSLNDTLVKTKAAVVQLLIDSNLFEDAKRNLAAITTLLQQVKDTDLKNVPKQLRDQMAEAERRQDECVRFATKYEEDPASAKACEELGQFYLVELSHLELAAPLLAKCDNPALTTLGAAYTAAKTDPKQLHALAHGLDTVAQAQKATAHQAKSNLWSLAIAALDRLAEEELTDSERGRIDLLRTSIDKQMEKIGTAAAPRAPRTAAARDALDIPIPGGQTLHFRLIPKGRFVMGDNTVPQLMHNVELTRSFYMGVTEVTQAQWKAMMGNNPSQAVDDPDCPVDSVSWDDCQQFITALNSRVGKHHFRLPSEAEWEYACRAGSNTLFSFGNDQTLLEQYGWYGQGKRRSSQRVGQLRPNNWKLYDMHGNVCEWVEDWYSPPDAAFPVVKDPKGPTSGKTHVIRGGDFRSSDSRDCTSFARGPGDSRNRVGLRLVVDIP